MGKVKRSKPILPKPKSIRKVQLGPQWKCKTCGFELNHINRVRCRKCGRLNLVKDV